MLCARLIIYSSRSASINVPPPLCKRPPIKPPRANFGIGLLAIVAICSAPVAPTIIDKGMLGGVEVSAAVTARAVFMVASNIANALSAIAAFRFCCAISAFTFLFNARRWRSFSASSSMLLFITSKLFSRSASILAIALSLCWRCKSITPFVSPVKLSIKANTSSACCFAVLALSSRIAFCVSASINFNLASSSSLSLMVSVASFLRRAASILISSKRRSKLLPSISSKAFKLSTRVLYSLCANCLFKSAICVL